MPVSAAPKPKCNSKVKPQATPRHKPRTRRAMKFTAKNLASHMLELLDDQFIENVLCFYTPELIALAESADPALKEKIRNAATENANIADICAMVDATFTSADFTPVSAD